MRVNDFGLTITSKYVNVNNESNDMVSVCHVHLIAPQRWLGVSWGISVSEKVENCYKTLHHHEVTHHYSPHHSKLAKLVISIKTG